MPEYDKNRPNYAILVVFAIMDNAKKNNDIDFDFSSQIFLRMFVWTFDGYDGDDRIWWLRWAKITKKIINDCMSMHWAGWFQISKSPSFLAVPLASGQVHCLTDWLSESQSWKYLSTSSALQWLALGLIYLRFIWFG